MAKLTAAARRAIPKRAFGLPGERFPMEDATHARMAISGATRAFHVGNISKGQEQRVKAEARRKLGE